MKTIFTALSVLLCVVLIGGVYYFISTNHQPGYVNGEKLVAAIKTYANDFNAKGLPAPETVSLSELIRQGLLDATDVRGFNGAEVAFSLSADETQPQAVIARARLADGHDIVALSDGSVQQMRR